MKPFSLLSPIFWYINLYLFLLITLNSLWFGPNITASASENKTDQLALLKFKELISNDPYGILESWNSSTHFCMWHGIRCNTTHQRVTQLNLTGYHLHGSISPHVGNLSFLRILFLGNNRFTGRIPQEIGRLLQLQYLDLEDNSLSGKIPTNLTSCFELKAFYLTRNNLIGEMPIEIGSLQKLLLLEVRSNKLTGRIPASIGNLSSLTYLGMGDNNLEGNIPQEISRLKNLTEIIVDVNKLYGTLPSYLYNMSSLIKIATAENQFNGFLPPNMFHTLPNLQFFGIGKNQISGPIPISITNASVLQIFDIGYNYFEGRVPSLGKLQDLWKLTISVNNLGGNSSEDLEFLKSLTNCSKLKVASISYNHFRGHLPISLGNLSTQLRELYLGENELYGKIPPELGNLNSLIPLTMENNHLEGTIPTTFEKFQKLQLFSLGGNKLLGDIPTLIGNLSQLFFLDLSFNKLEGNIPPSIGMCQKLQRLYLSQNNLSGIIPIEITSIFSLTKLDLSHNSLCGNLPQEIGRLKNINLLSIYENNLSGAMPATIGECTSLEYLYLQRNSFQGIIPSSLASLKGLQELDLSQNQLSGSIPDGLRNILVLKYFNVSFNMLAGKVPTEGVFQNSSAVVVTGNSNLCGGISQLHLPSCPDNGKKLAKHHNFKLILVIVCVIAFPLIVLFFLTIYWTRKRSKPSSDSPTISQLTQISYKELHNGTDGFSTKNLIGSGSVSSVYKGSLKSKERIVAIKVLNLQKKEAHKSFIKECNALRNVRHRNLVKILTCCSSIDYEGREFKALVFEFMTNGSLESWLHQTTEIADQPRSLDLEQRLNIITNVASAFHYLHYECKQPIIHCDLKPSNVLLDDCMVAHVSDFGLARLLLSIGVSPMQSSIIGIKGTIGYVPPEYGMGSEVSIEGDLYSFGILVLEMLTGRRPTDEMFKDGHNLHKYVKISISNNFLQIVDPTILTKESEQAVDNENQVHMHSNVEKCLHELFKIALACSVESPKERMNMIDVTRELNLIRSSFASSGFNGGSLHLN